VVGRTVGSSTMITVTPSSRGRHADKSNRLGMRGLHHFRNKTGGRIEVARDHLEAVLVTGCAPHKTSRALIGLIAIDLCFGAGHDSAGGSDYKQTAIKGLRRING